MQFGKIVTSLLGLLLTGMMIGPCVSAADNAITGNRDSITIQMSISSNASEISDLNVTTRQQIQALNPVSISNLKKINVPGSIESNETQKEIFSDRDWTIIRKSMTDLTEKEQNQLIYDWKTILNNTSSLNPGEQQSVSMKMGYYIINATEGGKPVILPARPGPAPEKAGSTAAAIPLIVPLIAIGGLGIIRRWMMQEKKKF